MIEIDYEGVEVGAEIDPDNTNPSENDAAAVRFYLTSRGGRRIYVSSSDARVILDIDRNAWLRSIHRAIGVSTEGR